jgi:hypothetical protein
MVRYRRGLRGAAEAIQNTFQNPIAQLARFAVNPEAPKGAEVLTPQSDFPAGWKKRKADQISPSVQGVKRKADQISKPMPHVIEDDDVPMIEPQATSKAQGAIGQGTPGGGLGGETPITPQKSHFGLENTRTVVLTQTDYLAVIPNADQLTPVNFVLRLNSPQDWFTTTGLATPVGGSAEAPGLWGAILPAQIAANWPATVVTFPNTLGSSERPQWRAYWEKMYQYYAVLGLEYEITLMNPQSNFSNDIVVASFKDSFSAANATSVHPKTATMAIMEQWPDVNFVRVPSSGDGDMSKSYRVIKGFHKPGSIHTNVENDEDVKTWTKVGSLPSITETMQLSFAKSWENWYTSTTGLNVRIDMRWIVQYKDLLPVYRWPFNQTAVSTVAPTDILYTP